MIRFEGIRKAFGVREILRGVDLEVRRGRVLALVGPNAAGKTTLIKSLLGLTRIDQGVISLDGAPVDARGAYRARIGYMPQIADFPENLTGAHLLDMLTAIRRSTGPLDDELLEAFDLAPHLGQRFRVLSGGTRQRLNAVMAFRFRPDVLILDEPTAGLDPVGSGILKDKIRRARNEGATVMITSHILSELEELADDVAFLLDGTVRYAGGLPELKRRTHQSTLERAIAHLMLAEVAA
ncbi:MAG TPA: ABC transporter ATP-binding protein [Gemmatimonadaceae bacterium]|nr:ABC transporter ATP-binding protein [Gemmatimonadaceae bacterium]